MKSNKIVRNDNITDAESVKRVKSAVKLEIEKKRAMNMPIAVYDAESGTVYATYKDGRRVAMSSRLRKGRYSEQEKQ